MDFIRIIRSLEEFIYELAIWVILIPKTFFKILISPRWIHEFVVGEFNKDENQRFDVYLSPIIIWMIIVLVPYVIALNFLGDVFSQPAIQSQSIFFKYFGSLSLEQSFFLTSLVLLTGPLGISVALLKSKKAVISKINLKRIFYTQCYCFTPASLFLLPFIVMFILGVRYENIQSEPVVEIIYTISANLFFLHLLFVETIVIKRELLIGYWGALWRFFLFLFLPYLMVVGIVGIIAGLFAFVS